MSLTPFPTAWHLQIKLWLHPFNFIFRHSSFGFRALPYIPAKLQELQPRVFIFVEKTTGGEKKGKLKKASVTCSDQRRVCVSESLSTFSTFPSLSGLAGAAASGREPRRQPCPLPAAFPGKRGRSGGGHRAAPDLPEAPLSASPFYLALPWVLPGQAGRKPPAPRGAARGTSGRPRRKHLWRPRRIPRRPQLEGPAAAGLARAGGETPRRGRGAAGEAEEEAAREQGGGGKGSPALSNPGGGKGWRSPPRRARSAGWRQGGRRRGQGWGVFNIPGWKDNSYSMFALTRSVRGTPEVKSADGTLKSEIAFEKVAGVKIRLQPLQTSRLFYPRYKSFCSSGSGSLNKGESSVRDGDKTFAIVLSFLPDFFPLSSLDVSNGDVPPNLNFQAKSREFKCSHVYLLYEMNPKIRLSQPLYSISK